MESTENRREARGRPRFLVVVGGSAGSIAALQTLVGGLPADLAAGLAEQVASVEQRIETIRAILAGLSSARQAAGQAPDGVGEVGA